ncbi:MAG: ATP-binding protein [Candidatus Liptonbacteria bacterium]|nr:ATP-binding protein [Candidatus Liptonbacteria bacterium]
MEHTEDQARERDFSNYFEGDEWKLPSDVRVAEPAAQEFLKRLVDAGWDEKDVGLMELAFDEAIVNAIGHGNLGIPKIGSREEFLREVLQKQGSAPSDLTVAVKLNVTRDLAEVTIRDQGNGFDWQSASRSDADAEAEAGRGIRLMESFFDEVRFNEKGNEVTLVKRFTRAAP